MQNQNRRGKDMRIRIGAFTLPLAAIALALVGCQGGSHKADAGSNNCFETCDPQVDGGCGSGKLCSVAWQIASNDQPVPVASSQIGVCVPAGTYADSCAATSSCGSGEACTTAPVATVTSKTVDTTFDVMPHMLAAVEMQRSAQPLAESMGRDLTGYSRYTLPPNIY